MTARAPMFAPEADLDLSEFKPKPPARPEEVRGVAEEAGFRSREPVAPSPSVPQPPTGNREVRRYRTGRNVQANLKVRREDLDRFYALADEKGWVLGQAFEHAVAALAKELERERGR